MDPTKREVVEEGLHAYGSMSYGYQHELYRILKVHPDGLTTKERAFLQRRYEELVQWNLRMSALGARLRAH